MNFPPIPGNNNGENGTIPVVVHEALGGGMTGNRDGWRLPSGPGDCARAMPDGYSLKKMLRRQDGAPDRI
ncbi:MAG: hypothetical protein AB2705_05545 [Candidatus Thiodiazotropha sp.]